jgi:hypothetical protein
MSSKKNNIEEKLEELGQVIGTNDLLVENVMSRIYAKSIGQSNSLKDLQKKLFVRRLPMSRFTKVAAAAVIIIAAVLSITFLDKLTSPAYGISDLPELLLSARTLHVRAWSYFPEDISPGQVQRRVALESWFDLENGLSRTMSAGYNNVPEDTSLWLLETIFDGQYKMVINHSEECVTFQRISPLVQKLHLHQDMRVFINQILGNPERLDRFTKVGEEVIDGAQYDIWQGEVKFPLFGEVLRIKSWISPTTGGLERVFVWLNERDSYEVETVERNVDISADVFATETPEGYKLLTTKENADIAELQFGSTCYQNTLSVSTHISFTMPDGSVVMAWHSADQECDVSQADLFRGLEAGGPLPKLPIEIYVLRTVGTGECIDYNGRHLSYTRKGGKFYEWSIYVSAQDPMVRSDFLGYYPVPRFNPPQDKVTFSLGLQHDFLIEDQQDFNTLVLGAMAELSDDGTVPENVTYDEVLQVAQEIRESLAK